MSDRSAEFIKAKNFHENGQLQDAVSGMIRCAHAGDPFACLELFWWYRTGDVVERSSERANYWMDQLIGIAEQGHPEAQWEVSCVFRYSMHTHNHLQVANYWLERAAESNCGIAQYHLALYKDGGLFGYKEDSVAAAKWYASAVESEHPEALYFVGMKRIESDQTDPGGLALVKRAAELGFLPAQDFVGSHH